MPTSPQLTALLAQAAANANDDTKRPLSKIYGDTDKFIDRPQIAECQSYYARICRNKDDNGYLIVHFEHDGVTPLPFKSWLDDTMATTIGFKPVNLDAGFVIGYTMGGRDPATIIETERI